MNPFLSTAVMSAGAAGVMALDRDELAPAAADWWTTARDMLRAQYGIATERGQTLVDLWEALRRRAITAFGESSRDRKYPANSTEGMLLELCDRWLAAFPLWLVALVDAEIPAEYTAVKELQGEWRLKQVIGEESDLAVPSEATRTWRAIGDLARAADARRWKNIETGTTGNHPDSVWDYADAGLSKLKPLVIGGAKGVLFDPFVDAAESVARGALPKLVPLAIAVGIGLGGAFLIWSAFK